MTVLIACDTIITRIQGPSGSQRPDTSSYVDKIAERLEDYRVLERLRLHAQITAAIHGEGGTWCGFDLSRSF